MKWLPRRPAEVYYPTATLIERPNPVHLDPIDLRHRELDGTFRIGHGEAPVGGPLRVGEVIVAWDGDSWGTYTLQVERRDEWSSYLRVVRGIV